MILAFDSETTSLDLWHGGLPYSFQFCSDAGTVIYIEWDVDPFTRIPDIKEADLEYMQQLFDEADEIRAHNAKFDVRAYEVAWKQLSKFYRRLFSFPFHKVRDSHISSHVLRNLWGHGLKDLRDMLLHVPRDKRDALKLATVQARKICQSQAFIETHGKWRIADLGDPHWPGIKDEPKEKEDKTNGWWLFDTWLPKTIWRLAPEFLPGDFAAVIDENGNDFVDYSNHPWRTVSKEYGIEDAETTYAVVDVIQDALEEEKLTHINERRHRLLQITYEMEDIGVSVSPNAITDEVARYHVEAFERHGMVIETAQLSGVEDFNPDSDKQLRELLYDKWQLPILRMTDPSGRFPKGQAGVDAKTLEKLADMLEDPKCGMTNYIVKRELQAEFIRNFLSRGKNTKSSDDLISYQKWGVAHGPRSGFRIHSNINIPGTKFTRQSTSGPNLQNVGTGKDVFTEEGEKFTDYLTRTVFCPRPYEEWLSIDFQSIEYLIWGFSCNNRAVIETFNAGEPLFKPIMSIVWGFWDREDKKYKKCKNGIYSRIYGSGEEKSDATFGKPGAVKLIEAGMPEIKPFTRKLNNILKSQGYIETIGGYRLYVEENEPHKVVSAFVQGHAGWVIGEAMIACHEILKEVPEIRILLQIHDELIFGGPKGFAQHYAPILSKAMQQAGEKYGIPTPTNRSLITTNWGEADEKILNVA